MQGGTFSLQDLSYFYFLNFHTLIMTLLFLHSSKSSSGMFHYRADVHIAISVLSQRLSCTFRYETEKKKMNAIN